MASCMEHTARSPLAWQPHARVPMGRSEKRVVFFSLLFCSLSYIVDRYSNSPGALRPCLFCTSGPRTPGEIRSESKRLRMRKLPRDDWK